MVLDRKSIRFEWDKGNIDKNERRRGVNAQEAEEVFFDDGKRDYPDPSHSQLEPRKIMVGLTRKNRLLFVVYTTRKNKIRIISARDLNKKRERRLYEETA